MAPKKQKTPATEPIAATGTSVPSRPFIPAPTTTSTASTASTIANARSNKPQSFSFSRLGSATQELWKSYLQNTPNSLLMIDAFMVFLMYVGGVQFVYACLTGGYPFNSFLAGFAGAVGQFVLAASLRSQVDKANRTEFPEVSPERAFADFVFSSIVLHFFVVNFLG